MDSKDQFQLIPGTKKKLGIKVPGENRFLYISSAVLGAVLVTSFAFNRYEASLSNQLNSVNNQISELEQQRDLKSEQELKVLQYQIENTSALIGDHIYWTQGFSTIANLMQSGVQINSFNYDGLGKVSMDLLASNYTVLAKQIAAFVYEDKVKDVSVSTITPFPNGSLKFDLVLLINERLIKKIPEK
ncbi:MAG: hypothetical protein A3B86_00020 [Candidatus Yanofskybacteria bacterium RIFCSPHIGHO2_02_FULL_38_22b]|uniref:Fimbrial assembly protein n=1 Tax=Candidatus Yanofskybacteria bacterium RIFCSPHIGHO2_02_FULL_38_22b TaxID=1802673 RepID=A0A1F8F1G4_9BACT|nr:MAG: hypothetical protein A2816_00960 [Candidatus Yanofskybacteria bacterium RIFCSPHIGHO2_01_FULL_39_44]OGN06982.1 MAG: hypothetical protein A3B86_00020 [Candidatus Yanofskybacteria bacterium RIFCSPHIGHO2_02_FULL_38_22b]